MCFCCLYSTFNQNIQWTNRRIQEQVIWPFQTSHWMRIISKWKLGQHVGIANQIRSQNKTFNPGSFPKWIFRWKISTWGAWKKNTSLLIQSPCPGPRTIQQNTAHKTAQVQDTTPRPHASAWPLEMIQCFCFIEDMRVWPKLWSHHLEMANYQFI